MPVQLQRLLVPNFQWLLDVAQYVCINNNFFAVDESQVNPDYLTA